MSPDGNASADGSGPGSAEAWPILDAHGLWRFYGRRARRVEAVRNVSLSVGRGEIFGLIGPDGAGKTSIIQMLAGVLVLDGGAASVDGIDVTGDPDAVKRRVGYMPQGLGSNLYDNLTVDENIEFFRDLRKLAETPYQQNRAELLGITRLTPYLDRRAADLSGGMRQKLALICTLIHLPDVLLLDEPTTGVDPISRQDFWQIIRRIVEERQATVLLSTSYMDEAERCHRIALLHAGAIVAGGTPQEVRAQARGRYATVTAEPQRQALGILRHRSDVVSTEVFGEEIHLQFEGELSAIGSHLGSRGIAVRHLAEQKPDLEDVFLEVLRAEQPAEPVFQVSPSSAATVVTSVECRDVTRRFDDFVAVDRVNLQVRGGEIFGLLGPNGAGKTTLIKMMCGLIESSAGTIAIAGEAVDSGRRHGRTDIGYMSQRFSLYRDLSVRQNLRLYADLYDVDMARCADTMAQLGLEPFASRLAKDLPIGVRQRLSLLCAVLHGPLVVFLDEPTSGVDPRARRAFWDLIYSLSRESGVTVLVSTHYMDEAAHCDRLGLMRQGRLIAIGSPGELTETSERSSGRLLAVRAPALRAAQDVVLSGYPGAVVYGDRIHVRSVNPEADRLALSERLERAGVADAHIDLIAPSMDETFIDFIQRDESRHA
jgi:ABC-2 type transport system ATP-binding protein